MSNIIFNDNDTLTSYSYYDCLCAFTDHNVVTCVIFANEIFYYCVNKQQQRTSCASCECDAFTFSVKLNNSSFYLQIVRRLKNFLLRGLDFVKQQEQSD